MSFEFLLVADFMCLFSHFYRTTYYIFICDFLHRTIVLSKLQREGNHPVFELLWIGEVGKGEFICFEGGTVCLWLRLNGLHCLNLFNFCWVCLLLLNLWWLWFCLFDFTDHWLWLFHLLTVLFLWCLSKIFRWDWITHQILEWLDSVVNGTFIHWLTLQFNYFPCLIFPRNNKISSTNFLTILIGRDGSPYLIVLIEIQDVVFRKVPLHISIENP